MISARIIMKVALACLVVAGISFILAMEVWNGFKELVFVAVLCGAVSVAVALIAQVNGTLEDDLRRKPRK